MSSRMHLVGVKRGYLLVWGGIHIEISDEEWDELVAQAIDIAAKRHVKGKQP